MDAEVPSPASGTISEILADAGDTVTVGQVLARLVTTNGASAGTTAAPTPSEAPAQGNGGATAPAATPEGVHASPVARRIAAAQGVDLSRVTGSGPQGRITKADVLAGENGGATATAPAESRGELIKGASAMLARYMDESREIPTATSFRTMTVTVMDGRRKQLKEGGQKVSFTHLIGYAVGCAATDEMPVMAHHFARARRQAVPHRRRRSATSASRSTSRRRTARAP